MSFLDTGYICTSLEIRPFELGGNLSFFTLFSLIQFGGIIKNLLVFLLENVQIYLFFLLLNKARLKLHFFYFMNLKAMSLKKKGTR